MSNPGQHAADGAKTPGNALDSGAFFPEQFGRFHVLACLGSGGMGTVYRAHDPTLDIDVALKVPHRALLIEPTVLRRFYREAQAAARLRHPGLCPVFEVGQIGDAHYLSMAYIAGRSLSHHPRGSPRQEADLARRLAEALASAHRDGVVHRDLKPSNILITPEGDPVIADFGLALRLDDRDERLTRPGVSLGTPCYMAPEQFRGDRDALGPGCDIYSLGVVLYERLTGEPPFRGPLGTLRHRVLSEPPVPPSTQRPELHPLLDDICLKALAKRSADRFPTLEEFAAALAGYLAASDASRHAQPSPSTVLSPASGVPAVRRGAIRFAFVGLGERAPAAISDRLYLDVGNDLRPGVIDHHHLAASALCTAALVLAHPELLMASPGRRPDAPFALVLHENPDLDCLASAYLAIGWLTERAFPPAADALARYVAKVDEGSLGLALANPFSLYSAYLQLCNRPGRRLWNSDHERWQQAMRDGLEVVAYALNEVVRRQLPLTAVDAFACPGHFSPQDREEVEEDINRYRAKLADPRCHAQQMRLRLPSQYGGCVETEALLVRDVQNGDDPERVLFFKDWARSDAERAGNGRGFVALSVFLSEGPRQVRRCILSVTPDSGASLQELGALLDSAEAERRRQVFGVDDRQIEPATGTARPPRPGYSNADPWYDGRAHAYTIVDAPRSGTLLTADEIEAIFLRFGDSAAL